MFLLQVLCAASVNSALFLTDHSKAMNINKQPGTPHGSPVDDKTISLIWVCTGVTNLSKVSLFICTHVYTYVCTYVRTYVYMYASPPQ